MTEGIRTDIGKAVLDLMAEKPFAKIAAAEIAEKAGVARATYYRQFGSKEEALS